MTAYEQVALDRERGAEKSASIYSIEIQTCAPRRSEESLDSRCLSSASKHREEPDPSPRRRKIR